MVRRHILCIAISGRRGVVAGAVQRHAKQKKRVLKKPMIDGLVKSTYSRAKALRFFLKRSKRISKTFKLLLYILVGASILYLFYRMIDLDELVSALSKLNISLLVFLVITQIVTQTLLACKLHILLKAMWHDIAFSRIFAIHLAGYLAENITPAGKVGGEPARIYLLYKEKIALKDALAVTIISKYIDLFPFVILLFLSFSYLVANFNPPSSLIVTISILLSILLLLSLLGIFLCRSETVTVKILRNWLNLLNRIKPIEIDAETAIDGFKDSMRRIMQRKTVLAQSLCMSIVVWLLYPLKAYIVFHTMGSDITFVMVVCVTCLACLISMIPVLPGGVGAYEVSAIALYGLLGIPLAEATVAVLISRVFTFWFVILLGVIAAMKLKTDASRT